MRERDGAPITTSKDIDPERELSAEAVTINRPARELYDFWRDQANLPAILENVESIEVIDRTRSRWRVKGPADKIVEWESVITKDVPGEAIYWQSAEGAEIPNTGRIEFREAGKRGTIVRAVIAYEAPAGTVGKLVAKLFQREPRIQSRRDLHRFKQLMETGEITTSARNQGQRENRDQDQTATRKIEQTQA